MRRCAARWTLWKALREELSKFGPYAASRARVIAAQTAADASQATAEYRRVVNGTHGMSDEAIAKQQAHRQAMQDLEKHQRAQAAAASAASPQQHERASVLASLSAELANLKASLASATSRQAGVLSLVQRCANAHAAEVAVESGIDVRSVNIVTEKAAVGEGVEQRTVGYIDAPAASEEEVAVYAARLEQACPAARMMQGHIEWRRSPPLEPPAPAGWSLPDAAADRDDGDVAGDSTLGRHSLLSTTYKPQAPPGAPPAEGSAAAGSEKLAEEAPASNKAVTPEEAPKEATVPRAAEAPTPTPPSATGFSSMRRSGSKSPFQL